MNKVRAENISTQLRRFPSQTEIRDRIAELGGNVSISTVHRVLTMNPAQQRWPKQETAQWIAKALGLKVGQFYSLLEQRRSYRQD